MIFKCISNEIIINPFVHDSGTYTLVHTFEKAAELGANFFNPQINETTFWCDNVDTFIKEFLHKRKYPVEAKITTEEEAEFIIEIESEVLCLQRKRIYTFDKRIAQYFNESINLHSQHEAFMLRLKSIGCLTTTFDSIVLKLKQYFDEEYKYYLPVLFDLMQEQKVQYSVHVFNHIVQAKSYLERQRIYNVLGDFTLKRDEKGRYIQCTFSESITGRLFQQGESLQTLRKDKRDLVVAETNCYLLEFDFATFEFNIILDLLNIPKSSDPHVEILNTLNLNADRDFGKSLNYSYIYGMSAENVCELIKEKTHKIVAPEAIMQLPLFKKKNEHKIKRAKDVIFTHFNRPIKFEKEHAIFNNFVQGTASDIFFTKFNEVVSLLPSSDKNKIVLQDHDSILLQLDLPTINDTDTVEKILDVLRRPIDVFAFDVEMKYGTVWSELA